MDRLREIVEETLDYEMGAKIVSHDELVRALAVARAVAEDAASFTESASMAWSCTLRARYGLEGGEDDATS